MGLGSYLRGRAQGNMLPQQGRSALVANLLQQSMQQPLSGSPVESLNIASKPILAALLAKQEDKARTTQQQALAGALSRSQLPGVRGEAARRVLPIIASGSDSPLAKAVLGMQTESTFAPATIGADPADVKEYNFAKSQGYPGSFTDYLREFKSREANVSANVQNAKYYEGLTPEERLRFVEANRTVPITDVGGVPTRVGAGGTQQPLSTLEREELAKLRLAAAQSQGSTTGTATGTAVANLPVVENTARQALDTVTLLRNHPGRSAATGTSRNLGAGIQRFGPWSSDVKNFEVLREQARGQIFLDAYQALKGGGPITDLEGQKAEQAKARMDAAQTDEEYLAALDEFEKSIKRGLELARTRAGSNAGAAESDSPERVRGAPDFKNMSDEELRRLAGVE